jgi:hypothetical protein
VRGAREEGLVHRQEDPVQVEDAARLRTLGADEPGLENETDAVHVTETRPWPWIPEQIGMS